MSAQAKATRAIIEVHTSGRGLLKHATTALATLDGGCIAQLGGDAFAVIPFVLIAFASKNSVAVPIGCTLDAVTPVPRNSILIARVTCS